MKEFTKINAYTAKRIGRVEDMIYQKFGKEQKANLWLDVCKQAGIIPMDATIDWSIDGTLDDVTAFMERISSTIKVTDIKDLENFKKFVLNGLQAQKFKNHLVLNAYVATTFLEVIEGIYNKLSEKQKAEAWVRIANMIDDDPKDIIIDWEDTTVSEFDKM